MPSAGTVTTKLYSYAWIHVTTTRDPWKTNTCIHSCGKSPTAPVTDIGIWDTAQGQYTWCAVIVIWWYLFSRGLDWITKGSCENSDRGASETSFYTCQSATEEYQRAWSHRLLGKLTHLPRDKMAAISQTIFSDAFSWMKGFIFWLNWSLSLCS